MDKYDKSYQLIQNKIKKYGIYRFNIFLDFEKIIFTIIRNLFLYIFILKNLLKKNFFIRSKKFYTEINKVSYRKISKYLSKLYYFLPDMHFFKTIEVYSIKNSIIEIDPDFDFSKAKILDIGCGNGNVFSAILYSLEITSKEIYGLDIFEQEKNPIYKEIKFASSDKLIKPYINKFDIIFINCVIEHLPNIDLTLNNLKKYLKKDGLIIFTTPKPYLHNLHPIVNLYNLLGFNKNSKELKTFLRNSSVHINLFSKKEWQEKLNGFDLILKKDYLSKENLIIYDLLNINVPIFTRFYSYYAVQNFISNKYKKLIFLFFTLPFQIINLLILRIGYNFEKKSSLYSHSCYVFKKL